MLYPYIIHTSLFCHYGDDDALLKCWKPEWVFNILMTFLVISEWMTENGIGFLTTCYKITCFGFINQKTNYYGKTNWYY
ncbi:hypothetical protein [Algibacter pacificus]|uniref:hypothetical protein n=1 Tax=Algibacter pacificus TaxID=2599389 RepID=UPI0011CBCAA2|nr:hypothetical protein [Algibacter pacificus]